MTLNLDLTGKVLPKGYFAIVPRTKIDFSDALFWENEQVALQEFAKLGVDDPHTLLFFINPVATREIVAEVKRLC